MKNSILFILLAGMQILTGEDLPLSLDVKNSEGQYGDKELNKLINRDISPEKTFWLEPEDFVKLPKDLQQTRERDRWWEEDKLKALKWESVGIKVAGYFGKSTYLENPAWSHSPRAKTIIVDLQTVSDSTPFIQGIINDTFLKRKNVGKDYITQLRDNGTRLILTGWLVWDNAYYKQWFLIITKVEYLQYGVPKEI